MDYSDFVIDHTSYERSIKNTRSISSTCLLRRIFIDVLESCMLMAMTHVSSKSNFHVWELHFQIIIKKITTMEDDSTDYLIWIANVPRRTEIGALFYVWVDRDPRLGSSRIVPGPGWPLPVEENKSTIQRPSARRALKCDAVAALSQKLLRKIACRIPANSSPFLRYDLVLDSSASAVGSYPWWCKRTNVKVDVITWCTAIKKAIHFSTDVNLISKNRSGKSDTLI